MCCAPNYKNRSVTDSETLGGRCSVFVTFPAWLLIFDGIGNTNGNVQMVIDGCFQVLNIIIATGQWFVVEKVGRRPLFLTATTGMLVYFVVWAVCSAEFTIHGSKGGTNGVVAIMFL